MRGSVLAVAALWMAEITGVHAQTFRCVDEAKAYGAAPTELGYAVLLVCTQGTVGSATIPAIQPGIKVPPPKFGSPKVEFDSKEITKLKGLLDANPALTQSGSDGKLSIQWLNDDSLSVSAPSEASKPSIVLKAVE